MNLSTSVWSTPGNAPAGRLASTAEWLERMAKWWRTTGWPAATEAGCSSAGRDILMSSGWRCLGPGATRRARTGFRRPPRAVHDHRHLLRPCTSRCRLECRCIAGRGGSSRAGRTPPAPSRRHTRCPRPRRCHHSANRKCLDVDAARDARGGPKAAAATVCTVHVGLRRRAHGMCVARDSPQSKRQQTTEACRCHENGVRICGSLGIYTAPRTVRCLSDSRGGASDMCEHPH
jgi:hypothetical protein